MNPLEPTGAPFSSPVFDALPFPAFVVDSDMRLLAANQAADRLLQQGAEPALRRRGGEALYCINSSDGCGKSTACTDCAIRNAVIFAVSKGQPIRTRTKFEFHRGVSVEQMLSLVTAAPLTYDGRACALLCIENLTVLLALTDALPICMSCKRVRDEGLWTQVEAYLDAHLELKFSHGLCPACSRRLYPEHFEAAGDRDPA